MTVHPAINAPDPNENPQESQPLNDAARVLPWFETWKQVIIAELLDALGPRRRSSSTQS